MWSGRYSCKVTSYAARSTIYTQGALSRSHMVIDYLWVQNPLHNHVSVTPIGGGTDGKYCIA